jgi:hypothetical protein
MHKCDFCGKHKATEIYSVYKLCVGCHYALLLGTRKYNIEQSGSDELDLAEEIYKDKTYRIPTDKTITDFILRLKRCN